MKPVALVALFVLLAACRPHPARQGIRVACAANLSNVLAVLARESAQDVQPAYGSTAALTVQIENGAPYDVFLAADRRHVEQLASEQRTARVFAYARGRLALYSRGRPVQLTPAELKGARFVALAKPELAPYGRAAVETLHALGVWDVVQPRLVFTPDVGGVRALVDSGNADLGFTALSLVSPDARVPVDPRLYTPIEQWGCVLAASPQAEAAGRFAAFVLSARGRAILARAGYAPPP